MILSLLNNATVANGGLGSMPALTDTTKIKQFTDPGTTAEKKLRAAGPNGSGAWQRTVLICATSRTTAELVAKVTLTNASAQAAPVVVTDPSSLWFAFAPGNGTHTIGEQTVTIAGDTEISATGATNGLTGISCSVEAS